MSNKPRDGSLCGNFEEYVSSLVHLEEPFRRKAAQELFQSLSCSGKHTNPVNHNRQIPICGDFVAPQCKLGLSLLRERWRNFTKAGWSTTFESGPLGRSLRKDFDEKKLLGFLQLKQCEAKLPKRELEDLPVPRHIPVVPFLQAIQSELSRTISEGITHPNNGAARDFCTQTAQN